MNQFIYRAVPDFWAAYSKLTLQKKEAANRAFIKFKANHCDQSLHPHKIDKFSTAKIPVRTVDVLKDLRVLYIIDGNIITSIYIGTHDDIYK